MTPEMLNRNALLVEYHKYPKPELKAEIAEGFRRLVEHIARKFAYNPDDLDDLIQVGSIGLLKAIDRFEPDRDLHFTTYATPKIIGEIQHYFRDKAFLIKLPRRIVETKSKVRGFVQSYTQKYMQSPTVTEIANALDLSEERVLESLEAGHSIQFISLDHSAGDGDDDTALSLSERIGNDSDEEELLSKETLKRAMQHLTDREQTIINYRFYYGMTQQEIADRLGISQMHISRILTKSLTRLKSKLTH
ncbi:MAG: SigB/SigF/SigG family RNA polymerase sigma factor [Candidatus Margulisiibacteriota bacterium]